MINVVAYETACTVDIYPTTDEIAVQGKAFGENYPDMAKYVTHEINQGRITEPGQYVLFLESNGNVSAMRIKDSEW